MRSDICAEHQKRRDIHEREPKFGRDQNLAPQNYNRKADGSLLFAQMIHEYAFIMFWPTTRIHVYNNILIVDHNSVKEV